MSWFALIGGMVLIGMAAWIAPDLKDIKGFRGHLHAGLIGGTVILAVVIMTIGLKGLV